MHASHQRAVGTSRLMALNSHGGQHLGVGELEEREQIPKGLTDSGRTDSVGKRDL